MDRNTYIDNIDVEEAISKYFQALNIGGEFEDIGVNDSLARITYEPVYARLSSPGYNAAAMDGIAVISKNTDQATENNPLSLELNKDYIYVNTGNQIVDPYDAVIMIEDVIEKEDGSIQILQSAYPWQHIRQIGEDIVATEMIIPSKHKIKPMDIGALISGGTENIKVYRKPKVGIIPTGSEIVETVGEVEDGKIIDSNSRVFEAMVKEYGGTPHRYSPQIDDYEILRAAILKEIGRASCRERV